LNGGSPSEPSFAVRGGEEGLHFGGGDAFAHDAGRGLVGFERDVLGGLHQRQFCSDLIMRQPAVTSID
jgi:hypothetical protein